MQEPTFFSTISMYNIIGYSVHFNFHDGIDYTWEGVVAAGWQIEGYAFCANHPQQSHTLRVFDNDHAPFYAPLQAPQFHNFDYDVVENAFIPDND